VRESAPADARVGVERKESRFRRLPLLMQWRRRVRGPRRRSGRAADARVGPSAFAAYMIGGPGTINVNGQVERYFAVDPTDATHMIGARSVYDAEAGAYAQRRTPPSGRSSGPRCMLRRGAASRRKACCLGSRVGATQ
jgi:hypothetical protein